MTLRLVFFGSSEFSLPLLEACLESPVQTVLVVTTPDQKKGRGLRSLPNCVRTFCLERKLPCEAFESLKTPEALECVRSFNPDVFVIASYGKIIPASWLNVPKVARLNVHPSLLPKYRGAAPLNWPILNGDLKTGLCIAEITAKLDSGDIFFRGETPVTLEKDSESLSRELEQMGKEALKLLLDRLARNESLARQSQDENLASYARKLQKSDGALTWNDAAVLFERKIRGLKPWPGAYLLLGGQPLVLLQGLVLDPDQKGTPGEIAAIQKDGSVIFQTGRGTIRIDRVKPAGKGAMSAADFIRGRRLKPGAVLDGAS